MRYDPPPSRSGPSWPYASLLFFGLFGADDDAGKRAALRGAFGLLLLVAGIVLVQVQEVEAARLTGGVTLIGAVGFLAWSTSVYLRSLDELSRLIQLEAFSWAYGGLFVLAFATVALGGGPRGAALVDPIWILVGEVLRGIALVVVARRYR